jgi:hypothetical protein
MAKMTPSKLNKLSLTMLKRIARSYNLTVYEDFTKQDIADMIRERLGEDPVAWILLESMIDEETDS